MKVSVIIPTLDASEAIGKLVTRLWDQDVRPAEIIVIDSTSGDETTSIAAALGARVITIPREHFNHGRTRNEAAGVASGDILLFMTQDAMPIGSGMIGQLVAPLGKPDIAASFGRQVPRPEASPLERFGRNFNYPDAPSVQGVDDLPRRGIKTFFFSDVCSAVKADIFRSVGRYPEDVPANEDMLLAARMIIGGYRIAYVSEAEVFHSHNLSLSGVFRRYHRIAVSLKRHSWVLTYARPEGEGVRFLKEQLRFIAASGAYRWIPYAVLEALAKYSGYRMGLLTG